jgi:hypothetical protein
MKSFYILSPDELSDLTLEGKSLEEAIANIQRMDQLMFFEEYQLEDCYVEELVNNQ